APDSQLQPVSLTGVQTYEIPELLAALVEKSLVLFDSGGRYMLPETMRNYAQERLAASGEAEAWRSRQRDHFLALAEEAEPHLTGPEQAVWLGNLEAEHDNLRAALQNTGD